MAHDRSMECGASPASQENAGSPEDRTDRSRRYCRSSGNVTAMYEACSAKGVVDGYDVDVRVLKLSEDDPERIVQFRLSSVKNR